MAMGAPVPAGVTLVSTAEPLLRPSFLAGGADVVYDINKDPNAELVNRVQFGAPNLSPTSSAFGTITSQQNTNRQLQGGVHILF